MNLHWWPESCNTSDRIESGAQVRQLTSAPAITYNLYCEQPYCSADGNRLALFRTRDADPLEPGELLVYDIERYKVTRPAKQVSGIGSGIMAIANAAWSGVLYACCGSGKEKRLVRFDINTLEQEELFSWDAIPGQGLLTVSYDNHFGLASARTETTSTDGRPEFGIYRVNLQTGENELIYKNADIVNPHLQFRLHSANRIMVQENRGCLVDEYVNLLRATDERGAGLFSIASDGTDRRDFPVAPPYTATTTGHECWIGDSDRVLVTVAAPYDDGIRCGNVLEVSHEQHKPRVVFGSPYMWNHISASRCGRFFVTDCYQLPNVPILIGSIATGKTRVLCESKTSGGGAQYSHAHPYITSDNRYVVFNSDRSGVPQVYIASIPDGFLESLESAAG